MTSTPINKVYNIVIYSHIALNCIDGFLKDVDYKGDFFKIFNENILPDHLITYLNEKSDKYLGIPYSKIDHTKLFDILHGTLILNDLTDIVESFRTLWGDMHDAPYMIIDDDIVIPGYYEKRYTARGVDYKVAGEIKDYLDIYDVKGGKMESLIRDIQLATILGNDNL